MKYNKAINILNNLKNTKTVNNGSPLLESSEYSDDEIEWAHRYAISAIKYAVRCKKQNNQPIRSGEKWSKEEDKSLRKSILNGKSIFSIAKRHNRSNGAIVARIERVFSDPS